MRDEMPRGRPKDVSDIEIFEAAQAIDDPAFGAAEIAEQIDELGNAQIRGRLDDFVDEGLLKMKEIGGVNVYWMHSPIQSPPATA